MSSQYSNIPVNIISGFLGSGKTTAISCLLQQKPSTERWAVIVNEFGKVGIDGALLQNELVEIKEIPGGCLCCVGSQIFNVGLNQLIHKVKPHRILIEPTGLGHPEKLLATLRSEYYINVVDLKAVITLLDARQLTDKRYTENTSYIDQIRVADVLLANKLDTYTEIDKQTFADFVKICNPAKQKVAMIEQGQVLLEWLDLPHMVERFTLYPEAHQHQQPSAELNNGEPLNKDWLLIEGYGNHYFTLGWIINKQTQFIEKKLLFWLLQILNDPSVERIKGVIHTEKAWLSINHTRSEQQVCRRDEYLSTKLEIISAKSLISTQLDQQLKQLVLNIE